MPPRCDVLEECILDKPVGLTDQECLEVRLVQAVIRGDVADVQQALKQGANINTTAGLSINMGDVVSCPMRQTTPLMRACALGHTDVVDVLLQARADRRREAEAHRPEVAKGAPRALRGERGPRRRGGAEEGVRSRWPSCQGFAEGLIRRRVCSSAEAWHHGGKFASRWTP